MTGLLLGFTGRPFAGKDTCARLLATAGFNAIAFADRLREEVAEAWRVDPRLLTDRAGKEWSDGRLAICRCWDDRFIAQMRATGHNVSEPRSPRWIMQRWGTEYRRASRAGYWLEHVDRWVHQSRNDGQVMLCVTDVRFDDEAALIRGHGGVIVRVHRPDERGRPVDTMLHASEAEIFADTVVHNDGDREHLRAELARVVAQLQQRTEVAR